MSKKQLNISQRRKLTEQQNQETTLISMLPFRCRVGKVCLTLYQNEILFSQDVWMFTVVWEY